MERSFLFLLCALSLSAFAQTYESEFPHSSDLRTVLNENPCLNNDNRYLIQKTLDRPEKLGEESIGVTSFGDVAVLKDNKHLKILSCASSGFATHVFPDITLGVHGCSFGQILVLRTTTRDGRVRNYRSPVYSEKASLCDAKSSSLNSDRESGKEVSETSPSNSSVNPSSVSQE